MAQPIYFAPGYESPSRVRLEGELMKAQLYSQAFGQVGEAISGYFEKKGEQRAQKLTTMTTLAGTYGSKALGPHFADDYGKVLASYGIHLPQNEAGMYELPESFEDHLRGSIMQHPEYIPALLGVTKPAPSPEEAHWHEQTEIIQKEGNNVRLALGKLALLRERESTAGRLQAAGILAGSREKVAGIGAESRQNVAQITAASKPYALPSGYYNDGNGKLVPAAKVDKDPTKYPKAFPLNQGQYDLMIKDKHLRLVDRNLSEKMSLFETKMRADLENQEMKPFLSLIGAAAKTKDVKAQKMLLGQLLTRFNEVENLGFSNEQMEALIDNKTYLQHFMDLFGNASMMLKPSDVSGGTPSSSTTTTTRPKGPNSITLPDGTVIYEHDLENDLTGGE